MTKWDKIYSLLHDRVENIDLDNLGLFLMHEVRSGHELKWFNDPELYRISYNESTIFRKNDDKDILCITSQTLGEVIPDFEIKKDTLQRLMDTWMKISKQYPDTIDITQEDNKFTFEFDNKDGHQKMVVE